MTARLTHRLEPGWTYMITVEPDERVRIDWSEPTTLMLQVPNANLVEGFPTRHGWVSVLDSEIVVEHQTSLTLRVEDALGNTRPWVSAAVRALSRSSKKQLPQILWGARPRTTAIADSTEEAEDLFPPDYLNDLRHDWPD